MTDTLRIVHVITTLDVGGAERSLERLLPALQGRGIESTVVSLAPLGPVAPALRAAGVACESLDMRPGRPSVRAMVTLVGILRRVRPHVVDTWLYHADLWGTLAWLRHRDASLVWNVRTSAMDLSHYRVTTRLARRLCVLLSTLPRAIVYNSAAGRAFHARLGYADAPGVVIHNGVDVERFRPDAAGRRRFRDDLGVPEGAILVGLVGRNDPMKGYDALGPVLNEVLALPNVHVVVVGPGVSRDVEPFRGWQALASHAATVHLSGQRMDIEHVMCGLDVLCLPSRVEAFPNVVAEAMACGVPAVATDVGDVAQIIGDTGWVVAPDDGAAGLQRALLRALSLVHDPGWSMRCASARSHVVTHFGLDRWVAAHEAVYRRAAGPGAAA